MNKRKRVYSPIAVILIAFIVIVLFVTLSLKGCRAMFSYYTDISDEEWMELFFYNANPGKHLGKYPDNIFCNVYNLKDVAENELLYVDGFEGSEEPIIFLNKEFDEPIKRFSIKKIIITKSDNAIIEIDDITILDQIGQMLQNEKGISISSFSGEYNASIYFDVACDLRWSCAVERKEDGSIHLIGYEQKGSQFLDYDVSNILDEIY